MSKKTAPNFVLAALAAGVLTLAVAPFADASAEAAPPIAGKGDRAAGGKRAAGMFIELSSGGQREALFDDACGTVDAEVLDPDSTSPRFILSGTCGGTAFDVVARPTKLPGTAKVERVRFLDIATGQERIADSSSLDVQALGAVGKTVAGRITFSMPATLNRPAQQITGTFKVIRSADRFSP